jgi:periplasmic protein TonB
VAYRTDITNRDRTGALFAAGAIQAALLLAFLNMSGTIDLRDTQSPFSMLNLGNSVPPPPPPRPPQQAQQKKEGGSAPKNFVSQATPVVARKPRIETPPLQKIVASEMPHQGIAPTQGASDVRGPGSGAGGTGNGTGSGVGGNGSGGGGGGVAEPPHLSTPVLQGYDFPRNLLDEWPRGATVFLRLRVDPRGYVAECIVDRGTGVASIDAVMCNLAHDRLRFRPALDRSGQPVAGWFGYAQPAPR